MADRNSLGHETRCVAHCGDESSGNSGSYDNGAAQRAQEAAKAAAAAEAERQAEADRKEQERLKKEQIEKEKREKEKFIHDRDEAASTLKGSPGSAMNQLKGVSGVDNGGLKGSGFDSGSQLKSLPAAANSTVDNRNEPAGLGGKSKIKGSAATSNNSKHASSSPSGDPKVVDSRRVPSGLPVAWDNAIAKAYSDAPPGVSDRVRKGFQAVMDRDWPVAKAWFEDALRRDPGNAGLKRLVEITGASQESGARPVDVDARNEPAGLGGKPDSKGAFAVPNDSQVNPESPAVSAFVPPNPDDNYFLFPGMRPMDDKAAMEFLFGLDSMPPSSKSGKTK